MPSNNEMPDHNGLIDKKLANDPIVLPESPFWEIFKNFGKDEMIALIINTVSTGAISAITNDPILISLFGPVIEKIGFFAGSSHEALKIYRTTSPEERENKVNYFKDAIKNGMPNLIKDIIFHDPFYTALMLIGLSSFPDTSVWMLSMISFLISVGVVTSGEVAIKEALYKYQEKQLERKRFILEKHLEARFAVKGIDPKNLIIQLADYFDLGPIHTSTYYDKYFDTKLKPYNAREPIIRLRKRIEGSQKKDSTKIQIVYTRASQVNSNKPEQYNFYPVAKDKMSLKLNKSSKGIFNKLILNEQPHLVSFTRTYAHIPEKILISVDLIEDQDRPYTVVEVKSFRNDKEAVETMIMAIRHIMSQYDVIQTTHSKRTLTGLRE